MTKPPPLSAPTTLTLQSAIGIAAVEVSRLIYGVQLLAPGLAAMGSRASEGAQYSAELRALVIELLPKDYYIIYRVHQLHAQLSQYTNTREARDSIVASVTEIEILLDRVLRFASSPNVLDLAGVPTSVASSVQTHSRSAIATVARIREALGSGVPLTEFSLGSGTSVTATAERILQAAVHVIPRQHRDRYREEFASELQDTVDASNGRKGQQLGYLLRLTLRLFSLRRELHHLEPSGPEQESGRRRVNRRAMIGNSTYGEPVALTMRVRRRVGRWRVNRMNQSRSRRIVLRERRLETQKEQLKKVHGWQGREKKRTKSLRRLGRNNNWGSRW